MITHLFWTFVLFQQADDFVIQERFRVSYVTLDVVAFHRKHGVVTDLKKEDFVVTDGKKKVQIELFERLDLRRDSVIAEVDAVEVEPQGLPPETDRSPAQIILAFDLESAMPLQLKKAYAQMRAFLKSMDPNQPVQINLYSLERGSVTKGFESRPSAVIAALDHYETRSNDRFGRRESSSFSRSSGRSMLHSGPNELADLEKAMRRCVDFYNQAEAPRCVADTVDQFLEDHRQRAERVIGQLESLTYHFQETDGLKIVFFVSPGFTWLTPRSVQEMAAYFLGAREGQRSGLVPMSSGRFDLKDEFQRVVHACVKNRVIFYTFDMFNTGSATSRSYSAEFGGSDQRLDRMYLSYKNEVVRGLIDLADDSGGDFFQVNGLSRVMTETLNMNTFYYVIGYQSPGGKPGKYRKIKIKCKRKGVRVNHRKGYIGAGS